MEIEGPDEAGAAAFEVVVAPLLAVSDAAPGALTGAGGGAGGGADTGGGMLAVFSQFVIVIVPKKMRGMTIIINPFINRLGDVLVMWVSSCVVIVIFNSVS